MALLTHFISIQVLFLISFNFLYADKNIHKNVRREAPRIVKGPGKIVNISPKQVVTKESGKSMDELLYDIYKKFSNDNNKRTLESNEKKGVIVNTDETTSGQQKKEANTAQSSAEHTIALRELEKTVDKLINSITKVSQDGKFEGKEIKKDIEKLSKFASLSSLNTAESKDFAESFDDFKNRFYGSFLKTNNKKRQNIIYHGRKRQAAKPSDIIYHGKDNGLRAQYHDQKAKDAVDKTKADSAKADNAKKLNELASLYDELKKQTADAAKSRNMRKPSIPRENDTVQQLKKDLSTLVDRFADSNDVAEVSRNVATSGLVKKDESVDGQLKRELNNVVTSLQNLLQKKESVKKETAQYAHSADVSSPQMNLKKQLLGVVMSLQTELNKENPESEAGNVGGFKPIDIGHYPPAEETHQPTAPIDSDLDNILPGSKEKKEASRMKSFSYSEFIDAMKGFVQAQKKPTK